MPYVRIEGFTLTNTNGGMYHPGRRYDLPKKMEVGVAYLELLAEKGDTTTIKDVAEKSKVSWFYANAVVDEYKANGYLDDPTIIHNERNLARNPIQHLSIEEEVFLLSLRAEDAKRPNLDYIKHLHETYGRVVSSSFITRWFHNRFEFKGAFKKANLVPLDKWRPTNIARYMEYRLLLAALPQHQLYNFLDEKHLVNKDVVSTKCRANPLTGYMDCIPVSGDFRQAYNLMAIISANPIKPKPVAYHIGAENGDSVAFYIFISSLIVNGFFHHHEVLVMDNAAIHTGGAAEGIEDLLWNTIIDGAPLQILVIYLPTRSPELNPIELIFHILSRRIRSFRYRFAGPSDSAVVRNTQRVLDEMSYELILKCYVHCGY